MSTPKLFRTLVCATFLAACATQSAPPALDVPYPADAIVTAADAYLQEAQSVAPHITVFASPDPFHVQPIGNVTAIEQSDGFVLVDAGGTPAAAQRIIAFLAQIDPRKPVKAIVITHWHGDHNLGLRTLLARWPNARTISTVQTQASLSSPDTAGFMPSGDAAADAALQDNLRQGVDFLQTRAADAHFSERIRAGYAQAAREVAQHARDLVGANRIAPRETFADRLVIPDRSAPVEILFLGRANTDGDAIVWAPRQRVLMSGDIVVAPIPYGFGSYPEDWIGVLNRLKAFDFETLVPGHGQPMHDRAYLDRLIALLTDVRTQAGALSADHTLEQVQAQVNIEAQADLFAGGDEWKRRWFRPYWALPIIASAYKEARGEPIVQGGS